jgi:hypothetical protein
VTVQALLGRYILFKPYIPHCYGYCGTALANAGWAPITEFGRATTPRFGSTTLMADSKSEMEALGWSVTMESNWINHANFYTTTYYTSFFENSSPKGYLILPLPYDPGVFYISVLWSNYFDQDDCLVTLIDSNGFSRSWATQKGASNGDGDKAITTRMDLSNANGSPLIKLTEDSGVCW